MSKRLEELQQDYEKRNGGTLPQAGSANRQLQAIKQEEFSIKLEMSSSVLKDDPSSLNPALK